MFLESFHESRHNGVVSLTSLLQSKGPLSASDVALSLNVSRPTLMRMVRTSGDAVIRYGKARATKYAATRAIEGLGRQIPTFWVDQEGGVNHFATMHFLSNRGTVTETPQGSVSEHRDVPWFIEDARPQGFLGRAFVASHPDLRLPQPQLWRADDTWRALAGEGDDLPGALLVGDGALARFLRDTNPIETEDNTRPTAYPALARAVLAGGDPGSSAGGEQPKFTVRLKGRSAIVKFSPPTNTPEGRRWSDLLFAEHIALQTLGDNKVSAAQTDVVVASSRTFLEVERFDRVGRRGRRFVVSLSTVEAEFITQSARSWSAVAAALVKLKKLSTADAQTIFKLEAFGQLIANSDRHLGNISLFWEPANDTFKLAPVYDMLPMFFRPDSQREQPVFIAPTADVHTLSVWAEMTQLAKEYWERVLREPRISDEFKTKCARAVLLSV